MYAKWIPSIEIPFLVQVNEMARYQVPREETSMNLTNISEHVYSKKPLKFVQDQYFDAYP